MKVVHDYLEAMRRCRWGSEDHPWFARQKIESGSVPNCGRENTYFVERITTTECAPVRITTLTWMRSNNILMRFVSAYGPDWDFYAGYDMKAETVNIFRINGHRAMSGDVMTMILGLR